MKKIKIDGVEGRGYLEVIPPSSPKTRPSSRGVAEFDTRQKLYAMEDAFKEGKRVEYEGVVFRDGKAKTETISVWIKKVYPDRMEGSAKVIFELG